MKNLKYTGLAAVVAVTLPLASCHFGRTTGGAGSDTLLYTNIIFEDSAGAEGHLAYQQMYIDYPVADDKSPLADSIRAWIDGELRVCSYPMMGEPESNEIKPYTGDLHDGEALVRHYASQGTEIMGKIMRDGDENEWIPMGYGNDYHVTVTPQAKTKNYVTIVTGYSIYTGGAHGLYICDNNTFDRATGHRMGWELVDTLQTRAELVQCLMEGLEEYFNYDEDASDSSDNGTQPKVTLRDVLFAADFNPETPIEELLTLPSAPPALTPEGVSFIYQQYEISAYAYGLPSCIIPYEKAKAFMTPAAKKLAGIEE